MHEITKTSPVKMPKIGQNMFENFFVHFCSYCLGHLVRLPMPLATMQSSERNTFILFSPETKMAINNFAPEVSFVSIKAQDMNKTI